MARIGPLPCPGDAPRGELGQAAALEGAYWDLRRAQHCLEAAHWLTGATAGEGFLQDYPTIERWRAAVAPRRSASFLAELLEACASSGVGDMPYPMPSPGAALSALLLEGPAEGPALRAKAALLGYYLVDGTVRGMVPSLAESLVSAGDASRAGLVVGMWVRWAGRMGTVEDGRWGKLGGEEICAARYV